MKKIIICLFSIVVFISCGSVDMQEINIDNTFTKAQLDSVVTDMQKENVELQFTEIIYVNGKIKELSGTVNGRLWESGSFSSRNFTSLKIENGIDKFEIEIN